MNHRDLSIFYAEIGKTVTAHSANYLSSNMLDDDLILTYPIQSIIDRLSGLYGDDGYVYLPYVYIWDYVTLMNIVLSDISILRRDLVYHGYPDANKYTPDAVILFYFGDQYPSRFHLLDYIIEMIQVEANTSTSPAERPIGSLMAGIFYLDGCHQTIRGKMNLVKGNLNLVSSQDLSRLQFLFGIVDIPARDKIEVEIINRQNEVVTGLRSIGCSYYWDGYSVDEILFQHVNPPFPVATG